MAKMPELVKLRDDLASEGLVVLGINFDDDVEVARKAINEKGLDWPHVHAPSAANGKSDLWEKITGVEALPRVFLIDRAGILRGDVYPQGLRAKIEALLKPASGDGK